jgi:hypothetical protein
VSRGSLRGALRLLEARSAIEPTMAALAAQRVSHMIMGYEEIDRANPSELEAPIIWANVDELLQEYLGQVEDEWSSD